MYNYVNRYAQTDLHASTMMDEFVTTMSEWTPKSFPLMVYGTAKSDMLGWAPPQALLAPIYLVISNPPCPPLKGA